MSLLFTQCNNTGTDIIGFQITVFISYKQTRVTQPPRYTITFLGSHHSSQMPLKELKMLPNFSKLSTCLASGQLDVTTNRIHFINKIPQMKSEDCFIFFHKLCCPVAITKAWRSQVPIYGEACKETLIKLVMWERVGWKTVANLLTWIGWITLFCSCSAFLRKVFLGSRWPNPGRGGPTAASSLGLGPSLAYRRSLFRQRRNFITVDDLNSCYCETLLRQFSHIFMKSSHRKYCQSWCCMWVAAITLSYWTPHSAQTSLLTDLGRNRF